MTSPRALALALCLTLAAAGSAAALTPIFSCADLPANWGSDSDDSGNGPWTDLSSDPSEKILSEVYSRFSSRYGSDPIATRLAGCSNWTSDAYGCQQVGRGRWASAAGLQGGLPALPCPAPQLHCMRAPQRGRPLARACMLAHHLCRSSPHPYVPLLPPPPYLQTAGRGTNYALQVNFTCTSPESELTLGMTVDVNTYEQYINVSSSTALPANEAGACSAAAGVLVAAVGSDDMIVPRRATPSCCLLPCSAGR